MRKEDTHQQVIKRLMDENKELKQQLYAIQDEFAAHRQVQLNKIQQLDGLLQEMEGLKRNYEVTIQMLDKAKDDFDKERNKYWQLRKEFRKAMKTV